MRELAQAIPDVEILLALEPEELGAKILFLLRKRLFQRDMFVVGNLTDELWTISTLPGQQTLYPKNREAEVNIALAEAWAWLQAQGLVVTVAGSGGRSGWKVLSRRAKHFESEAEFTRYAVARSLTKEALHPKIAEKVWMAFMRGEFDAAVFQAMKAVEVSVRDAAGLGNNLVGVALMREAFSLGKGHLTDPTAERGEQLARMELFTGAIGSYKNPNSHRDVDMNDPSEAVEIILLANHLLRIVAVRVKAREASA